MHFCWRSVALLPLYRGGMTILNCHSVMNGGYLHYYNSGTFTGLGGVSITLLYVQTQFAHVSHTAAKVPAYHLRHPSPFNSKELA